MSHQSQQRGISEQDRTLSDLLETYRHLQSDPHIPEERKQAAAERMKDVWADLAKLRDPDGFINHVSSTIQREHARRHNPADVNGSRRGKPLCRCDRSKHVCEVKQGEVPSKIRTQDLQYLSKPDSRTLARDYIQEHSGDVVVREAMESFRGLRADIYSELSSILAMMMGRDEPDSEPGQDSRDAASASDGGPDVQSPTDTQESADARPVDTDGGAVDPSAVVDRALASAVERHGADTLAADATDGALNLMSVMEAYQNGDVSTEDLKAVADGERELSELNLETDSGNGGGEQ